MVGWGRVALSPTLSAHFLFLLLRLVLGLRVLLIARPSCEHPACQAAVWAGVPQPQGPAAPHTPHGGMPRHGAAVAQWVHGERWWYWAGLGQVGTAEAALVQLCLSPSVPHGPISHESLSPDLPSGLFRSRQLLHAVLGLSELICTGGEDVCVCSQPAVPKSSTSGWQKEVCAVVAVPLCLSRWACPALGSWGMVTPADGTEGVGREHLVREVSVWQPAMSCDFTSHSSAPLALPCCHPTRTLILCPGRSCPHAQHTAPSPLAPLCSTPASPSISRLSCPTSPTPRTIRLPQCICRQQDGQPGRCFSRYCGHPAPGWHSVAPPPPS